MDILNGDDSEEAWTRNGQIQCVLFTKVADVKQFKSSIKVWISVGGWSFSDNDNTTQPLFGEIAASATKRRKRQTFADNVVKFLENYGFDGKPWNDPRFRTYEEPTC